MLGRNNEFFTNGGNAEDQMKINVVRHESQEITNANIYKEAARRVVFSNCMKSCDIDPASIPNFNKNFYYNMLSEQACLQDCYNDRMKSHFGERAEKEHLLIDFQQMKSQYQRYEKWNPNNRIVQELSQQDSKTYVQDITSKLINKTKRERYGKFDFQ